MFIAVEYHCDYEELARFVQLATYYFENLC